MHLVVGGGFEIGRTSTSQLNHAAGVDSALAPVLAEAEVERRLNGNGTQCRVQLHPEAMWRVSYTVKGQCGLGPTPTLSRLSLYI